MTGSIHVLGPQAPNSNLANAVNMFCPQGDIAVISAGWRYDECELQQLQTQLGRRLRHIPLYEWFDALGSIEPELAGLHRMRQRRILDYKKVYQINLDAAMDSWAAIHKLYRKNPDTYAKDEREACKHVQQVDRNCLKRLTQIKHEFEAILSPWLHDSALPLHEQIIDTLDRCSGLIITGGHAAILRNRLAFFGLGELLPSFVMDGKHIFAWSAGAMCLTDQIVLFHDSPPWGKGRTETLDTGMGLLPKTVLLPNATKRLKLGDSNRVERFAKRFYPSISICLENGSHLIFTEQGVYDRSAKRSAFQLFRRRHQIGFGERMTIIASLNKSIQADRSKQKEIFEDFLETYTFPLIEPGRVTFFYWSMELVDSVLVQHSIHGLETEQELQRLSGTNAFWLTIQLPDEARVEYQYILQKGNQRILTLDPHNSNRARQHGSEKSVCTLLKYQTPEWTTPHDEHKPGTIEHIEFISEIFADTRTLSVYLPNEHQEHKRYPLLLCLDGDDYCAYGDIKTVLDNLMGANEMLPTIVAFIGATDRDREFAANPLYAQFLTTEVIKHIEGRFNILKSPDKRAIMGVGLGAVMALYTTWRHPGSFERALLQSGRFIFTDVGDHGLGSDWDSLVGFVNSIRETPILPKTMYLSCGVFDSMIYYNRTMAHIWEREPIRFRYVESKDGHNWISWRDRLREGLTWIFPDIYE